MRTRVLSEEGCKLFNLSIKNNDNKNKKICFRSILFNLFHSKYDDKIEKYVKQLNNTACKLYVDTNVEKDNSNISKMINNAITNIILLILSQDEKILTKHHVKKNLRFYLDIAEKSYKNGDLHTANIIKAVFDNYSIQRLNLKLRKKDLELMKVFKEDFGDFKNACLLHLKHTLENKKNIKIPSLMILLIHLNKNKEYLKWYKKNGKIPNKLIHQINKIEKKINYHKTMYKESNFNLIELYKKEPETNIIVKKIKGGSLAIKLGNISKKIKK